MYDLPRVGDGTDLERLRLVLKGCFGLVTFTKHQIWVVIPSVCVSHLRFGLVFLTVADLALETLSRSLCFQGTQLSPTPVRRLIVIASPSTTMDPASMVANSQHPSTSTTSTSNVLLEQAQPSSNVQDMMLNIINESTDLRVGLAL